MLLSLQSIRLPVKHLEPTRNKDFVSHLLLNKALYGLKQSTFEWSDTFHDTMFELKFQQSTEGDNIYVKHPIIIAI